LDYLVIFVNTRQVAEQQQQQQQQRMQLQPAKVDCTTYSRWVHATASLFDVAVVVICAFFKSCACLWALLW